MNTQKPTLRCDAGPEPEDAQRFGVSAVLRSLPTRCPVNLAALARSIAADKDLRRLVTQAAQDESGLPMVNIEDAIVLLGVQRLSAILAGSVSSDAAPVSGGHPPRCRGEHSVVPMPEPQIRKMQ